MSIWNLDSLKEYIDGLRKADLDANDQRFQAQETAITKAESNRDNAIKKAEDSIEKKSDAVYVKLTDLQKAFSEVMLRPEVESRFTAVAKDITEIKKTLDQSSGKGSGVSATVMYVVMAVGLLGTILSITTFIINNSK